MKRIFWWTLFGVTGAGLPALWFGQSVLGQPEVKVAAPLVITADGKSQVTDSTRSDDAPRRVEWTSSQVPNLEPAPKAGPLPPPPSGPLTPPAPVETKAEPMAPPIARVEKPV